LCGASHLAGIPVSLKSIFRDDGKSWQPTKLGTDYGKYSFRQWETNFTPVAKGNHSIMVRCTNSANVAQPDAANWNSSGFMRNVVEAIPVTAI
jgi:hypothetical protein